MSLNTAVVWTRASGEPRRLGTLVFKNDTTLFAYDDDAGDLPGLSVVYPPSNFAGTNIEWRGDADEPLHPSFMALVPPLRNDNLQYRIGADRLAFNRNTPNKEWRLLTAVGRGSIGHIDVFPTDSDARDWYSSRPKTAPANLEHDALINLAVRALDNAHDPLPLRRVLDLVGQAPSPGGAMPKLLHSVVWPGTGEVVEALIKFEKAGQTRNQDILVLEDWAYGVHERFGLSVPRRELLIDDHGNHILATERFDRIAGTPIPCETLYCALKILDRETFKAPYSDQYATEPSFNQVALAIRHPRAGISSSPAADGQSMFARIVLSYLTANGDLHLKNTSILGKRGTSSLSPVYDPAPMRLYAAGEDALTAVSFGGLRFFKSKIPDGFGDKLIDLGIEFGMQEPKVLALIRNALSLTEYAADEMSSASVAGNLIERFELLQKPVREEIRAAIQGR